jgi:hypothetical protein
MEHGFATPGVLVSHTLGNYILGGSRDEMIIPRSNECGQVSLVLASSNFNYLIFEKENQICDIYLFFPFLVSLPCYGIEIHGRSKRREH